MSNIKVRALKEKLMVNETVLSNTTSANQTRRKKLIFLCCFWRSDVLFAFSLGGRRKTSHLSSRNFISSHSQQNWLSFTKKFRIAKTFTQTVTYMCCEITASFAVACSSEDYGFLPTVCWRRHLVFVERRRQDECRHLWRYSANAHRGTLTVRKYTANC